ncbi:MFS transporter [Actinomadura geliboluensis]|uniref:MFS transporter n=1 Tax=Actinomadura geliboluensis TaxID=882440 RepID=UPI001F0DF700|nr:MFS transporter [Actinomadura geliboluensis]
MFSGILSARRDASSPARAWLVLCSLAMLQFFIAVDVTVVNVALPSIGAALGADGHALTWVVVGYTITGGGLLMLGGRLGDTLGRRRVLLLGTALFGAASLLAGLAPSFPALVAARLLQGAGEALALPAAMAVIVLLFPEGPRRSRALSVWAAVASCGLVLGFVVSGAVTELLGWRWIFLISVPFILAVLAAAVLLVPGERPAGRAPLDLPGAFLLTAAPLLFTLGVVEAGAAGGTPPWLPPVALAGAVAAGAGFVRAERRAPDPLVPPRFFRNRTRVLANLATALLSAALSASFLLFSYYLQDRAGAGPLRAGLTMLPLAVSLIAASVLVPRLLGRWGARRCVLAGIGFTALAMASIALVARTGAAGPALVPAMVPHRRRDGVRDRRAAVRRGDRRDRVRRGHRLRRPAGRRPARRLHRGHPVRRRRVRARPGRRRPVPGRRHGGHRRARGGGARRPADLRARRGAGGGRRVTATRSRRPRGPPPPGRARAGRARG